MSSLTPLHVYSALVRLRLRHRRDHRMSMPDFVARRPLSVAEYLRIEESSPTKHEYVAGELFAMSGVTRRHNRIVLNIATRLLAAARAGPCSVLATDVLLQAAEDVFYYPDVMVDCNPASHADRTVRDPCVVVEVASPSTSTIDRREKLAAYRKIDSVRAYLIVEQTRRRVEHHWRDATGAWWREELVDAQQVPIPCLDVGLTFDEIYDGVTLPAVSEPDEVEYVT